MPSSAPNWKSAGLPSRIRRRRRRCCCRTAGTRFSPWIARRTSPRSSNSAPGDGARFDADINRVGADAPFIFALLGGSLWSWTMLKLVAREAWRRGLRGLATFFGEALGTARGWLETRFQSELVRALFAPWVLHTGLGPESAYSGEMAKVIAFALEVAGAPIVKGGAKNVLAAFERLIRDQGGDIIVGADVERVLVDAGGGARGVRLAGGREIEAAQGRDLLGDAQSALRPAAGGRRIAGGRGRLRRAVSLRQRQHAGSLCAEGAAANGRRRRLPGSRSPI